MTSETSAPPMTRMCAAGNHVRCLGTVYDPTQGLVACACPTEDCGHGTETEKARRNKT